MGCPGQSPGALAEYVVMPAACCFPIPDSMTLEQAALVEPLSIAVHAVRLPALTPGRKVGILGAGPIGLCVQLAVRAVGPATVYATDLLEYRRDRARQCGADWVGTPERENVVEAIRTQEPDCVFATARARWQAVVEEIRRVHGQGRPILVGTRSVEASEHLSGLLGDIGLGRQVLNAVRHAEEASIIARAGQQATITVATNMAGRGTDIKLGRGIAALGGLHVIATERHESGRIDRQLAGRAGRQGDPGTAVAYVSLEDELVARSTPHAAKHLRERYAANFGPLDFGPVRTLFSFAQRRAERLALRQRRSVLRSDDWLDESLGFAGQE